VPRRVSRLLVVPLLVVAAGCTDSGGTDEDTAAADATSQAPATDPGSDTEPGPAATGELAGVTVTGPVGDEPEVKIPDPVSVDETTVQVLERGDGREVAEGDQVTVSYVFVNGTSGNVLDNSYERGQPLVFQLQAGGTLPGLYTGLLGQPAGSRVALAIPPQDGFGPQGNPQLGLEAGETLVFVIDIEQVSDVPTMAEGEPQRLPDDLPELEVDDGGIPQRFVAEGDERASLRELVVAPVIVGTGPKVQPGQTMTVQYLGQLYPDGQIFDQSWTTGQPFGFQLGTGGVIPGWDQGLDGQRVGSRVVLAIPSDLA